jgi:hypothetical protein
MDAVSFATVAALKLPKKYKIEQSEMKKARKSYQMTKNFYVKQL